MRQFLKLVLSFLGLGKPKAPFNMKNLAVFDFDHTVVDDNSDTAVLKLVDKSKISPELRQLQKADEGWTAFMQGVFDVLHQNKILESNISLLIKSIPEVKGIKNLILELHNNLNYDVIIISDSNTYFINVWLQANNLSSRVLHVFSNPAQFDEQGLLNIKMYHVQNTCNLSTKNMCKGSILENFIKSQAEKDINYQKVVYVGDGQNDFCPILRLGINDVACVRNKYKCADLVKKAQEDEPLGNGLKYSLKAQVCFWDNGQQILDFLRSGVNL